MLLLLPITIPILAVAVVGVVVLVVLVVVGGEGSWIMVHTPVCMHASYVKYDYLDLVWPYQ